MQIKDQIKLPENSIVHQPAVFYRITALWALSEAFLGGVLHALHLPGTGLFVGGAAVLCISLLAFYCPARHAILKATILVILIKGMLSPHSPPGAYLAVFIQGGLGYLFFWSKRYFKVSCLLLGVITQLQSALQRLVVMLIVFGADLYQVADGFVDYILKKAGIAAGDYVLYVVLLYIGLHVLMGVLVGWLAGRLPRRLKNEHHSIKISSTLVEQTPMITKDKRKSRSKFLMSGVMIGSIALLASSLYFGIIDDSTVYAILARAILILVIWVWVLSSFLQRLLLQWSNSKKSLLAEELSQIISLMPFIKQMAHDCWLSLAHLPLLKRIFLLPVKLTACVIVENNSN
ncbi:hypothetical protein H8S95_08810 [Pontibacter sp. KCTC 32443]|uniref:hypothetical protein n=1 Tax=Pontibacter TaxID=323449 RepID=UPI00164D6D46|nr:MULTISPECIES: hypothetical protein [Pontibacter]MBC5774160.1 hypothetical protein [Pontibacter sp. KCTC 32443]